MHLYYQSSVNESFSTTQALFFPLKKISSDILITENSGPANSPHLPCCYQQLQPPEIPDLTK